MSIEQRSHDLAIAFITYKATVEANNTDYEYDEDSFFSMYKNSYDQFFEMLTLGQ